MLLHLEPERGLLRSTEAPDRMELEGQDFHVKVADAYLKIAEEHPERFVVVDADKPPASVFDAVREAIDRALLDRQDGKGAGSPVPASEQASSEPNPPAGNETPSDPAID